ncbi:MAG: response regulator transcription factor [Calditrichia bacterium]|nr:response regulator transcription factor [Calditrichia bacterium]
MINIFIVDDHYLIREGLKKILDREIDISVVGEACNANEAMQFLKDNDCDIIVLDISMPGKSGLELLQELKVEKPKIKTLILSMHPEERFAIRTFIAGASGYITKERAPEELVKAIQKIYCGGKYVSQTLAEKMVFDLDKDNDKALHEKLSDREYQVLCQIGLGKKVNEISNELCLSFSTVNTYRSRILEKMGMTSNAELIRYAIKNNLVD